MPEENEEDTLTGFRIQRTGRGLYLCRSESDPDRSHSIDLLALNTLGMCDCQDFQYRHFPRWKSIQLPLPSLRCKHLKAVREHALDQILLYMLQKEAENDTPK